MDKGDKLTCYLRNDYIIIFNNNKYPWKIRHLPNFVY